MTTEQRIRAWLADPANIHMSTPAIFPERGFEHITLRNRFVTKNGLEVSIQQGASHYCNEDSVEMWCCPHHPLLDPYGDGESPYGWVPITVVAQYIDALEGEQ
jgi:hypothetical protein